MGTYDYKGIEMNGTVIVGGVIMFFIISGLISSINKLHDDVDVSPKYSNSKQISDYKKLESVNIYGEIILIFTEVKESQKSKIWNESFLNQEMLELFPNFTDMKQIVENRLVDDGLFKKELLKKLNTIEDRYIGGLETSQSAKAALSSF